MSESRVGRPPEEWRVCPYDETVQISSRGRVRRNGKLSTAKATDKDGYLRIKIKGKSYGVHRLVAELFIPNPDNLPIVDHINNIHNDNRQENLRWTTIQGNTQFAADMGLLTRYKNSTSVVIFIDKENIGHMYSSVVDGAREFDLDASRVSMCISGKTKSINGYKVFRVDNLLDKRRTYGEPYNEKKD